jgi:uncharacterized protein (UPF0332 family)
VNPAFEKCLKDRKIILFPRAKRLALKELAAAEEDLAEAKDRFNCVRYKYATINAYYAIFHAARALIYSKGIRERSHYCLAVALEALFVDAGLLGRRYVRIFQDTMALREDADYGTSFSEEGARVCISGAEDFVQAAEKLLKSSKNLPGAR